MNEFPGTFRDEIPERTPKPGDPAIRRLRLTSEAKFMISQNRKPVYRMRFTGYEEDIHRFNKVHAHIQKMAGKRLGASELFRFILRLIEKEIDQGDGGESLSGEILRKDFGELMNILAASKIKGKYK